VCGGSTRWCSGLRHCATKRLAAGLIPESAIGIFHWHNPSGRTVALWSTQPLTEISTRNISWWVKAAGAYGWQPYHLHVPTVLKSGSVNLLEPSGPVQACNGIALPLHTCVHACMHICIFFADERKNTMRSMWRFLYYSPSLYRVMNTLRFEMFGT
jgi:hypothetical protein